MRIGELVVWTVGEGIMRAFMSQSDERRIKEIDADQLGFASAFQWGLMAEREARAILAETERAVWGEAKPLAFLSAFHEERWPDYPCIDCAAGRALIEALAAFVEG